MTRVGGLGRAVWAVLENLPTDAGVNIGIAGTFGPRRYRWNPVQSAAETKTNLTAADASRRAARPVHLVRIYPRVSATSAVLLCLSQFDNLRGVTWIRRVAVRRTPRVTVTVLYSPRPRRSRRFKKLIPCAGEFSLWFRPKAGLSFPNLTIFAGHEGCSHVHFPQHSTSSLLPAGPHATYDLAPQPR